MHFLTIDDLTTDELAGVVDDAAALKRAQADGMPHEALPGRSLAMLFEKPSTRTRVSFEVGMTQLGGHGVFLGDDDIQLGRGEPVADTARALGRYVDAVMARVFDHGDLEEIAAHADVPVVNGLTDDAHPCQALADLLTLREEVGDSGTVAWVGDGNNVAASFTIGAAMMGYDVNVATPEGYGLDDSVIERAEEHGDVTVTTDPEAATADAEVVYTDVWVSMGQEDEREQRLDAFEGFQVDADLLGDAAFMHCLPANRGEEVTADVIDGEQSVVWQQAENRLHAQKALLVELVD
ncbi:ornithine carbamoyltransferase [Halobacterium hubeiense]|jgi:ornithine carbamoyltransferase|uniref:Ornithine carbamoyltransferase n=1 Tax=Halobacterium hubeiense TaxID=1407499 RepID=A0A0U5HXI1_9EURY|nr:ornithine carbamoyltransferase [Halobacterium hubeiense]CQH62143.1 ornithine carbamoyltransferase [Halobacterium hubeiense]